MIIYLLKSASCLALLLFFYHFILEKEKMHNFNRFYLLGSILFSFLVPLATITIPNTTEVLKSVESINSSIYTAEISPLIIEEQFNYTQLIIRIYLIISGIFLIRFSKNLFKIVKKTKINEKVKHLNATLVLVDDEILPHTFWKTIFINKTAYKKGEIEEELFTHELTHVTQKHTLDVLLIEVLQIVFWINPLFIFLKKAIQLNHEFLADEKVINQHKNTFQYQHLLLNKAAWKNEYYLASNLNYSLTKKRLKMMTTQSSQKKILLKKLTVIPLLAGFIFLFAERVEAQDKQDIIETVFEQPQSVQKSKINITEDSSSLELIEEQVFTPKGEKVKTGFKDINEEKYFFVTINNKTKFYNKEGKLSDKNGYVVSNKKENASNIIPGNYLKKIYLDGKVFCDFIDNKPNKGVKFAILNYEKHLNYINTSTIDYIKKYKNKNILYYFNERKIKYKKALDLIENNRPIEILTQKNDGKTIIRLTKEKLNKPSNINIKQGVSKINKKTTEIIDDIRGSKSIKSYKTLNKLYESKRNAKPHFIKSLENRQKELSDLFSKLGSLYFKLSKADKKRVKRPIHPHDPYLRLMKNNKVFYKLRTELTREDKLLIPPPPPPQNASEEVILKAKIEYDNWKKRTGNTISVPPPPKKILGKIKITPKKQPIYINKNVKRKFISQNKLAQINPSDIATMNVIKGNKGSDSIHLNLKENHLELKTKYLYATNFSTKKSKLANTNSVKYYLDNKLIAKKEMKLISPEKIKSVNVKKNKDGSGSIYITSKKN